MTEAQHRSSPDVLERFSRIREGSATKEMAVPVGVFLLGVAISSSAFVWNIRSEREFLQQAVDRHGMAAYQSLRRSLETPLEVLYGITSLYAANTDVSRIQFRRYVAGPLSRHSGVFALQWSPLIKPQSRESFEKWAAEQHFKPYFIFDKSVGESAVRSPERDEYLPIVFDEPQESILGFDLLSEPIRKSYVEAARDSGEVSVSGRFRLVEDPPGVYSIALFAPIYRTGKTPDSLAERKDKFAGIAGELFRIDPYVKASLASHQAPNTEFIVLDSAAVADERLLFESKPGTLSQWQSGATLSWRQEISIGRRSWTFITTSPDNTAHSARSWAILLLGLGLSALFTAAFHAQRTVSSLRKQITKALQLGQYTIEKKIGQGGMGTVYLARHAMLRRPTAIKLIISESQSVIARFEREVQSSARLTHGNTISIYDFGKTPDGVFYYAMEYIEGVDLEKLVQKDGPLSEARTINILKQMCASLHEAHVNSIIHRDIKPSNVMICVSGGVPDFVKVFDFGLAKNTKDENRVLDEQMVGTPYYMSPESIAPPFAVDPRADIYAVGAVGYFLLTGLPPFPGYIVPEILKKHLEEPPPDLKDRRIGGAKTPGLEALLKQCLHKDKNQRPASARVLQKLLDELKPVDQWTEQDAQSWWDTRGAELIALAKRNHEAVEDAFVGVKMSGRFYSK